MLGSLLIELSRYTHRAIFGQKKVLHTTQQLKMVGEGMPQVGGAESMGGLRESMGTKMDTLQSLAGGAVVSLA